MHRKRWLKWTSRNKSKATELYNIYYLELGYRTVHRSIKPSKWNKSVSEEGSFGIVLKRKRNEKGKWCWSRHIWIEKRYGLECHQSVVTKNILFLFVGDPLVGVWLIITCQKFIGFDHYVYKIMISLDCL